MNGDTMNWWSKRRYEIGCALILWVLALTVFYFRWEIKEIIRPVHAEEQKYSGGGVFCFVEEPPPVDSMTFFKTDNTIPLMHLDKLSDAVEGHEEHYEGDSDEVLAVYPGWPLNIIPEGDMNSQQFNSMLNKYFQGPKVYVDRLKDKGDNTICIPRSPDEEEVYEVDEPGTLVLVLMGALILLIGGKNYEKQ